MTLEEGIVHAEDVARMNHEAAKHLTDEHPTQAEKCEACAKEHEQLAEWLKELKAYRSRSEIPNTCGDVISREAAIRAIEALQRPIMREESNYYQFKFSGMSEALGAVENLPSVTPQQRTGRWIGAEVLDKIRAEIAVLDDADYDYDGYYKAVTDAVKIIDKYRSESEDKE